MMRKRTMWSGGGDDPTNGHPYVEIAGIKWATMNIGAESETDYGLYFQWGDTQGYTASQVGTGNYQKPFDWADYKFGNGTSNPDVNGMVKYNGSDGKTVLDLCDDAARLHWGGYWRMPTKEDITALANAVINNDVIISTEFRGGIQGALFTDSNDSTKKMFIPFSGSIEEGLIFGLGDRFYCWTAADEEEDETYARNFGIMSDLDGKLRLSLNTDDRFYGFTIRPVYDDSNVQDDSNVLQ